MASKLPDEVEQKIRALIAALEERSEQEHQSFLHDSTSPYTGARFAGSAEAFSIAADMVREALLEE